MIKKIDLIKKLDRFVGSPMVPVVRTFIRPKNSSAEKTNRVLFIRPGGIGDGVLLLPVIMAFKEHFFNDVLIDILCEARNSEVFTLVDGLVNNVFLYDRRVELLQSMLAVKYDVVIDTEQWYRFSAIVAYLTTAPVRIGFNTNERGSLFTHPVYYDNSEYEINSFKNLILPIVNTKVDLPAVPFLKNKYDGTYIVDVALENLNKKTQKDGKKIVSIFPGASMPQKRWPSGNYGLLAKRLFGAGFRIVILGGNGEQLEADAIMNHNIDAVNLVGKTTLKDVCNVLSASSLLITPDSGLLHLALAVGTKSVSLFGASSVKKWGPKNNGHKILNKNIECSPCSYYGNVPHCDKNVLCMSMISVDDVFIESLNMLGYI